MKRARGWLPLMAGSGLIAGSLWWAHAARKPQQDQGTYLHTIRATANMVNDGGAQQMARRLGLHILNLTWEDTGRYKNSAAGPNISDMTIQDGAYDPQKRQFKVTCMPVIRYPNFRDTTCDLDPRDFTLLVGNQAGRRLKRLSLYDFLADPSLYLSRPDSWRGQNRTLLCNRDSKVLVSAQACFLPVPRSGRATFNPVVFNYQSVSGDPAVLTILATREGTSVTIIDNKRDAFRTGYVWGQRLFHNQDGRRASLTGERLSDYDDRVPSYPRADAEQEETPERRAGLSMVLLIQVPLRQKNPMRFNVPGGAGGLEKGKYLNFQSRPNTDPNARRSDVEEAVIGHGEYEGPFTEIDNLAIERDTRFPIRVTVQFYKATSNGVVSGDDLRAIKAQMDRVYSRSCDVGSLVTDGRTGRITEYEGAKVQPPDWWARFWERHWRNTGDRPEEAQRKLRELLGIRYWEQPVCDLYLRNLLRKR